jgi:hypothetical protein
MSTANTALRVTELDFDSIKSNLKDFLRGQSEFQDFDFEGSGMSVLLDILAYNTHYMGYYLNMVGNEMFLDTAQIRSSMVSHAKMIGYTPGSIRSAKANVNIVITPSAVENQNTSSITLDRYIRFIGEDIDGQNYPFITQYSNTVSKVGSTFTFNNIRLIQGEVITAQFVMDSSTNPKRRFDIPSMNVDTTTLSVTVQESSTNTSTIQYNAYEDLTEVKNDSPVYFIEENTNGTYTLIFGDDIIGKKPKDGNIIVCKYIDTVGSLANNISSFALNDDISGYKDSVVITSTQKAFGGTEKETIEQVRFRAPYAYTAQNRAVTVNDYETLLTKDYNNIESVSVWGGEDNDPVVYGKIYMSLKTRDNYFLSNLDKENIKQSLIKNRNVVSIIPEIVDPDYTYVKIRGIIKYNSSLTNLTANQIRDFVIASIQDYNDRDLNTFKSTFRKSKLQAYMENADPSITGTDIQIELQKRQLITLNTPKNYILKFDVPIRKGDFNQKLSSFPQLVVKDISGINRNIFFEEVPQSFTGISNITIVKPGINYTSTPTVTITGDGLGATARAVVVNRKINRIEITNKGSEYTRATVSITGGGGSEATAIAKLENKIGTLRSYYFKPNGEKVIVSNNVGTINYDTGIVSFDALLTSEVIENDFYDDEFLTINVPIGSEIIPPVRNRILSIDFNDPSSIQLEVVAEK